MTVRCQGAHVPTEVMLMGVCWSVASPFRDRHGVPENITSDRSTANEAAIAGDKEEPSTAIVIRHITYRNNIVEQDHRAVKRIIYPMLRTAGVCGVTIARSVHTVAIYG